MRGGRRGGENGRERELDERERERDSGMARTWAFRSA